MTVLDPQIDPATGVGEDGAEALIKEARRLRRRRWLFGSASAALAAGGLALGVTVGGSVRSPASAGAAGPNGSGRRSLVTSASPVDPTSIAVLNGDLYIADPGRQEILRRSPAGRFSVVAGTGVPGFSGDGGLATRARIDDPDDLVTLRSGSLLFEQGRPGHGGAVREITPSGVIRTVIGLHPSCAGVGPGATSIAANSAAAGGLSVSANGSPLLSPAQPFPLPFPQPCPHARRLGPFLELTRRGELTDIKLDTSPLIHSMLLADCGLEASGSDFTAYACASGAGGTKYAHSAELLVVRNDRFSSYPDDMSEPNLMASSATGEVIAAHNDSIVRLTASALTTLVDERELDQLFLDTVGVAGVNGLAVDQSGDVFVVANYYAGDRHGCGDVIAELTTTGRLKPLWRSATGLTCG